MPGNVSLRSIERLRPHELNPRKHSAEQIAKIATSLREFGWTNPILVDAGGRVIAGHARLEAARQIGLLEVPVLELGHMTPAQLEAYLIADNRLALDADWDDDLLADALRALEGMAFDLALTGFDESELLGILGLEEVDDPPVPAPPATPCTRRGDLWILGDHRLLCGDSGSVADLDRLLAGAPIHLVNTDPPYNVNVEPRSNNARAAGTRALPSAAKGKAHLQGFDDARVGKARPTTEQMRAKDRPLQNDFMSDEDFERCLRAWFSNVARALAPGRAFYIWGGFANWANYCAALEECGLRFAQGIVWVKRHPVLGRKDMMNDCEFAWYGWRDGAAHHWYGPNNVSNVWEVKKVPPTSMVHLTEKPVELAARAMRFSSRKGENVLDLFGGSGSTLIAAHETGRRSFTMETDAPYCDVIVQRWMQHTGGRAVLEETGEAFDSLAEARRAET